MTHCLIGLGANQGDRQRTLEEGLAALARAEQVRLIARSGWHDTAPVGGPAGQGPFLNGAAVLDTSLAPGELLDQLLRIESEFGRHRTERWGPRTIDLDLLLHGQTVCDTPRLVLPHPRMAWRRFVLAPAAEIAASMLHPTIGRTIAELLEHLNTAIPYVALAGPIAGARRELAEGLVQAFSATWISDTSCWPCPVPAESVEGGLPAKASDASPECPDRRVRSRDMADVPFDFAASLLKCLDRRAQVLRADLPQWLEPGRLWVSDFWWAECLAWATVWLAPDTLEAFRARWHEAGRAVVAPKLTVLFDVSLNRPSELPLSHDSSEARRNRDRIEKAREALVAQATRPRQGPVLRLGNIDRAELLLEVRAAIEAMA